MFGTSWHLCYLSRAVQYLTQASQIPPSDPRVGACLSVVTKHLQLIQEVQEEATASLQGPGPILETSTVGGRNSSMIRRNLYLDDSPEGQAGTQTLWSFQSD